TRQKWITCKSCFGQALECSCRRSSLEDGEYVHRWFRFHRPDYSQAVFVATLHQAVGKYSGVVATLWRDAHVKVRQSVAQWHSVVDPANQAPRCGDLSFNS